MHFQVVLTSGSPGLCERISSSSNLLPELAKGIVVREADLSEPNGRTLFKKECSTWLAISPAGHIRYSPAKQYDHFLHYLKLVLTIFRYTLIW